MELTWVAEAVEKLLELIKQAAIKNTKIVEDLRKLQLTMVKIQECLTLCEGRDCRGQSNLLNLLHRLNEAMYNAEDLIDDIKNHPQREAGPPPAAKGQVTLPSSSYSSFLPDLGQRRIGRRIREIRGEIEDALDKIQIEMQMQSSSVDHLNDGLNIDSYYPGIVLDDIVGLEDETASLVNVLTGGSNRKVENGVYAIVGIPGIGKTTLAKMVYNSLETDNYFDKKIWICVGNEDYRSHTSNRSFFEKFIKNYNENDTNNSNLMKIEQMVMRRRLLIVLDDCWSSDVWMKFLRAPVSKAEKGSAVLMTSRNRDVAEAMSALEVFTPCLAMEDAWLLLHKEVFGDYREISAELKCIGEEIVAKCKRVPLAIKAISGVIRNKGSDQIAVWRKICESNIWAYVCGTKTDKDNSFRGDVLPALLLSYFDLPYYLKLCFCHCSNFPRNFKFHHQRIVQHWIAEGFVPSTTRGDMDIKGTEYYRELISRNFLQSESSHFDDKASTMHDMMHELGKFVSSKYFVSVYNARRLYEVDMNLSEVPEMSSEKARGMRTLVLSKNPIRCIPEGYLEKIYHLRVLDLSYTAINKLPDTIGELVHLRLLNLSYTCLETLPESVRNLKCLQSLQLNGCKCLKELPGALVELSRLTCLLLETARLHCLPLGLGQLQKLRTLNGFLVNRDARNMDDLYRLSGLTDLTLYRLERLTSPEGLPTNILRDKRELAHLRLSCNYECDDKRTSVDNIDGILQVFEKLHPPSECISIHIDGYIGNAFPSWMRMLLFHDLKWLRLENCKLIEQLPPLGELRKLKVLDIRHNSSVTTIGSEFIGNLKFPQLEELHFIGLLGLRLWSGFGKGAFPHLKKLNLVKCPELKYLPSNMNLLTSLREMNIEEANKLREIKDHPAILMMRIRKNPKLKDISYIPKVNYMIIRRCRSLENIKGLSSLSRLALSNNRMESLPEWLKSTTSLKRLDLEVNKTLLARVYADETEICKFRHIDHVEVRCYIVDEENPQSSRSQHAENSQIVMNDVHLYVSYTKAPYLLVSNLNRDSSIMNNSSPSSNYGI